MSRTHTLFPAVSSVTLRLLDTAQAGAVLLLVFFWREINFSLGWVLSVYVVTLLQKLTCPSGKLCAVNLVPCEARVSPGLGGCIYMNGGWEEGHWKSESLTLPRSDTGGPGG